jgi:hypothetical protein
LPAGKFGEVCEYVDLEIDAEKQNVTPVPEISRVVAT